MLTPRQRAAASIGLLAAMRARSILNLALRRHRRTKPMTNNTLPTERTNSKGQKEVIKEMLYSHLKNATLKAERTDPKNPETLAMRQELDQREADYAAEEARKAAEGQ